MNKNTAHFLRTASLSLLAISFVAMPSWAAQLAPSKGSVKVQKLDMNQLGSLPDDAVIDINGKQITKRQFMAGFEVNRQRHLTEGKEKGVKSHADFQAKRSTLLTNQKAQVDVRNTQARSEMSRFKANAEQYAKIRAEAIQLNTKYASASPAEKDKIEQRAGELMAQLKKLGY